MAQTHDLIGKLDGNSWVIIEKLDGNSWVIFSKQSVTTALVFVHGFRGDPLETWKGFDVMPVQKSAFQSADLYFFGYDGLLSNSHAAASFLFDLLDELGKDPSGMLKFLSKHKLAENRKQGYARIIVVSHSLGAVVSRWALLRAVEENSKWLDCIRTLYFAPAHRGSNLAQLWIEKVERFPWLKVFAALLLRHHRKAVVIGSETGERDAWDQRLAAYSQLAVAAIAGYVPIDFGPEINKAIYDALKNSPVRTYYESHYKLLLPSLLRLHCEGDISLPCEQSESAMEAFEWFWRFENRFGKSSEVETFLRLLDGCHFGDFDRSAFKSFLKDPPPRASRSLHRNHEGLGKKVQSQNANCGARKRREGPPGCICTHQRLLFRGFA